MRVAAPAKFEGEALRSELEAAGYGDVHVVCFEDGTLEVTGTVDGVEIGEGERVAVEAVVSAHHPPPPTAPLPDPVPKLAAEFERVLDMLVEKKLITPGDRQKIKGPR